MKNAASSSVADAFASIVEDGNREFNLQDGSRVAVVGGGPAGSFFSYFLCKMAEGVDLDVAAAERVAPPGGYGREAIRIALGSTE